MTEHTPGPWEAVRASAAAANRRTIFSSFSMVGSFVGGSKERVGEFEANASLIAAAPTLLNALELLLAFEPGGTPPLAVSRGIAVERARAAIAKARGAA